MTTTMPTPGDLARRTRPLALTATPVSNALPPRPAVAADAPFRARYEIGIRYSTLHHNARHVALTIATFADWHTGLIQGAHPGVPRITAASGLSQGLVRNSLKALATAGWITRIPSPYTDQASRLFLTIPPDARTAPE